MVTTQANMREKILLVDDDARTLELLGSAFSSDDRFEVLSTTDGDEALRLCAEQRPTLVLLDVSMPGRGGYSVCRMIKQHLDCGDIQVILLSALADQANWDTWRKVGADDFVTKPFSVNELHSMIAQRLGLNASG